MKAVVPFLLAVCLTLLPISSSMAQAPNTEAPQYNTQYGPFAPGPQTTAGSYSTVTPQAAVAPSSPTRALAPAVSEKPFSDYHLRPAISPWMNLYQFNPSGGTVSNYYTLVKPFIDQERTNKTLRSATQAQGNAINYLDQKTDSMLDLHRPGYYMMNHNSYFGGR